MHCNVILVPAFTPTLTEFVSGYGSVTVNWTTSSTDADGYVVNATSETHTVTRKVQGGNQGTCNYTAGIERRNNL